jgi:heme-degrading monooxygenase HmoA
MMTVVTPLRLKTGGEPEWDAAMREPLSTAREGPGWIGGQLLIPLDGHNKRTVIGTWDSRADWEAWHEDPTLAKPGDARVSTSFSIRRVDTPSR